jgi:hypothetical protein
VILAGVHLNISAIFVGHSFLHLFGNFPSLHLDDALSFLFSKADGKFFPFLNHIVRAKVGLEEVFALDYGR